METTPEHKALMHRRVFQRLPSERLTYAAAVPTVQAVKPGGREKGLSAGNMFN